MRSTDPAGILWLRPGASAAPSSVAGMSAPAMSRHLRVLLAAGVIEDERIEADARARVFRLRPQSLVAVRAWLDQIQAGWNEQLASYKRHVEGDQQ